MASNYSTTDDEDRALQDAINASLRGSSSNPALKLENEVMTRSEAVVQPSPKRVNIDDRIKDMALRAADELPLVHQPGGDTWVFIDPPPMQPEQDQLDYARYIKRYEKPILVKKDSLTKHSQIFEKAFEPTAQFRVVRRRNLVKALRESNIKYVIDLTPPSEGEEAVYLMTELCCSEGVRLWYQAGEIWRVANTLVGGEEEYTSVKIQNSVPSFTTCTKANADTEAQTNAPQDWSPTPASPKSTITNTIMSLEYSPVRHRSAIERVLDALLGWDPKLDSAPKVWTTFAVAKYFDIKHSKLDDYIISWLRAYPNSYFLEVLPEVSLQIAEGLENYELARDTFAILVGEEALDNLRRARNPIINNKLTTYGRKKEDLPEHIRTRIEYASKSFLERITKEFAVFVGEDMLWIDALPEYRKLATHTQLELQEDVNLFKRILKEKQESETTGQSESPFTKYKDELDMNPEELDGLATLAMDHPEYTRRSTPPFFRDDDALFDDEYLAQRSNQPHTSQQNKVTVYPSQSNPNKFFDLKEFFSQASSHIKDFARTKLYNADQYVRPEPLEIGITNTLVCLQDSEWKYLPLWAGGNDDGSGGVFNDHVPMADLGFSTAGPDVHDGTTPASSSIASSEFEVISAHSDATSTFNTSMANNRGFSDHMHRGRVYAADSADSVSSHQDDDDNFTIVTDDDDEDHARMQMEAQERIEMAEEAAEKEARRIEKGRGKMEDENYADLFSSDDGDYGSDETDRAEYGDFEDVDMDESDDGIEDLVLV
ncbi:hypothetical protein P7C71_g4158, partial [Lecanoromycetidae sp. Uapishka_2]